ncbi:MAG: MraY family glycosyltransferase [Acidimicrobiia bacterium]
MTLAWVAAVLAAALAVSGGVTELVRRRAVRRADYDVPNERSSHAVPTPRGGGLGIVVAVTAGGTALAWGGRIEWRTWLAVALPGLLVALVGWLDDRGRVRVASVRLALHAVAAVALVTALGGLPPLTLTDGPVDLGWAGHALAVVYVVWMLNLFNFMDGIDGITAVEAMAVCACVVGVEVLAGAGNELLAPPALVAAASAGFLVYNWPPARIFLGDVGSGYVGYLLAALSLVSAGRDSRAGWVWLVAVGVFAADATVTVVRRLALRERVTVAHRTHAYQHLATDAARHLPVTLGVGVVTVLWLGPWGWAIARGSVPPLAGAALAYAPLVVGAWAMGAGRARADARAPSSDGDQRS